MPWASCARVALGPAMSALNTIAVLRAAGKESFMRTSSKMAEAYKNMIELVN
jgi:hypothetical protein